MWFDSNVDPARGVPHNPVEEDRRELFKAQAPRLTKDTVIRVADLSKCYAIYSRPHDRLKQSLVPRLQRMVGRVVTPYYREFWALRDVSFEVRRGETVGIVGRNGAGKSTLLQILCGTLQPTAGNVEVYGRVAALLELGSGFNPEFSGSDNVYMNGALLGLSRAEIDQRFDEIAAFADIGDFIGQPLKTYSSGMQVRLGFAVAACVDPDILIVDEALAVGDVKFQAKCFRRLKQLMDNGTSILFVSHSIDQIARHCDRAVLLEGGRVDMIGAPKDVTNRYLDLLFGSDQTPDKPTVAKAFSAADIAGGRSMERSVFERRPGYNAMEYRWGNRDAEITDFIITSDGDSHSSHLVTATRVRLTLWVEFHRDVAVPIFELIIKTPDGITVFGSNSRDCMNGPVTRAAKAGETLCVTYAFDQLLSAGDYLVSLGVAEDHAGDVVPLDRRYDSVHITVSNNVSRSFGLAEFKMTVDIQ